MEMNNGLNAKSLKLINGFTEAEKICVMLVFDEKGTSLFLPAPSREASVLILSIDRANDLEHLEFVLWQIVHQIENGYLTFTEQGGNPIDYLLAACSENE